MEINRFSARLGRIDQSFLIPRLTGAVQYDRISGYFTSSVLHLLREPFDSVKRIRMICNSDLNPADVAIAQLADEDLRRAWHGAQPELQLEQAPPEMRDRLRLLHSALVSKKIEIRVLPDKVFGFMHGKAGIITHPDGVQTAFMGSVNDTANAWSRNYELLWEDPSPEGVAWVQAEFDALWNHKDAHPLAQAVIDDLERLAGRTEISLTEWRALIDSGIARGDQDLDELNAPLIEAPLYTSETGLWPHQKAFVHQVMLAHSGPFGHARLLLADQVGLGKTLQLAVSAQLIALQGDAPVLISVPKTLLRQWQAEMWDLLRVPSARWDSQKGWIDEFEQSTRGFENCPRRIALVSSQWLARQAEAAHPVFDQEYALVILDEAHRARKSGQGRRRKPNTLYKAMVRLAGHTRSLLLATATPVQLDLIEAYELLQILAEGAPEVLGGPYSQWNTDPLQGLELTVGRQKPPTDFTDMWAWYRSPFPPSRGPHGQYDVDLRVIRQSLGLRMEDFEAPGQPREKLAAFEIQQLVKRFPTWISDENPYITRIVMRTREALENLGQLQRITVDLHGDKVDQAVPVIPELLSAYALAEKVCEELGKAGGLTGFARTALLRRISSSLEAGYISVTRMLEGAAPVEDPEEADDDEDDVEDQNAQVAHGSDLEENLKELQWVLGRNREDDPKIKLALALLRGDHAATGGQPGWLGDGCILFTQYLDTARQMARALSAEYPELPVGLYSNGQSSGTYLGGVFSPLDRQVLKERVRSGELTLLVGTDAASEGLNLQRLSNLINIDLPWNPSRLEQRKGRIQRIGQKHPTVRIYNMRYFGSIEDRVHQRLSERFGDIAALFGLIPEVIKGDWVDLAQQDGERIKVLLDHLSEKEASALLHPFARAQQQTPDLSGWDACTAVLREADALNHLRQGW
ncbi:helicase-related protein [Deinococcus marmoris]|uniref:helicase-related protein n=1 Tax=Deinococcus marmoris TaxID=249408 RepID=UPI000496FA18|nr:helicase-related protein [Deinococcus marmoris]